jgi:hypothetical protein
MADNDKNDKIEEILINIEECIAAIRKERIIMQTWFKEKPVDIKDNQSISQHSTPEEQCQ